MEQNKSADADMLERVRGWWQKRIEKRWGQIAPLRQDDRIKWVETRKVEAIELFGSTLTEEQIEEAGMDVLIEYAAQHGGNQEEDSTEEEEEKQPSFADGLETPDDLLQAVRDELVPYGGKAPNNQVGAMLEKVRDKFPKGMNFSKAHALLDRQGLVMTREETVAYWKEQEGEVGKELIDEHAEPEPTPRDQREKPKAVAQNLPRSVTTKPRSIKFGDAVVSERKDEVGLAAVTSVPPAKEAGEVATVKEVESETPTEQKEQKGEGSEVRTRITKINLDRIKSPRIPRIRQMLPDLDDDLHLLPGRDMEAVHKKAKKVGFKDSMEVLKQDLTCIRIVKRWYTGGRVDRNELREIMEKGQYHTGLLKEIRAVFGDDLSWEAVAAGLKGEEVKPPAKSSQSTGKTSQRRGRPRKIRTVEEPPAVGIAAGTGLLPLVLRVLRGHPEILDAAIAEKQAEVEALEQKLAVARGELEELKRLRD